MYSDIFISAEFFNAHDISQPRFYDPVLKSTVECLNPLLGTDDMCLLSNFVVVVVQSGRYSRNKQVIMICVIFYEGSQYGTLIKLWDLIWKEWSEKTSFKREVSWDPKDKKETHTKGRGDHIPRGWKGPFEELAGGQCVSMQWERRGG